MYYYYPENLDLNELLSENPPDFKFKIENFKYLLSLITSIPGRNKQLFLIDGFTPISSRVLKSQIPDYKTYFTYLQHVGIISTSPKYTVGGKCKGYKYTEEHRTPLKSELVVEDRINRFFINKSDYDLLLDKEHEHLIKWLTPALQIDREAALDWSEFTYRGKIEGRIASDYDSKGRKLDPFNQRDQQTFVVDCISRGNFLPKIDQTGYRFHSALTFLKSEVRNFVSFDGHELVCLDLKNSQPYLSTAIFNQGFWTKNPNLFNIYEIYSGECRDYLLSSLGTCSPMLSKMDKIRSSHGFQRYVSDVTTPGFYLRFFEAHGPFENSDYRLDSMIDTVADLKTAFLTYFNPSYRYSSSIKSTIKADYPELHFIVRELKRIDRQSEFSTFLHAIESTVVLFKICKRAINR